jgi:hypothetical protein
MRGGTGGAGGGTGGRASRPGAVGLAAALAVLVAGPGCSASYKKLSSGGSAADVLVYDVFGADRDPSYYYSLVKRSHDEEDFCYRCGADPYLVDKNIDAIQRLGDAQYGRLEGQAQVLLLLAAVATEDRSPLARAASMTTLTKIGVKLPRYPAHPVDDDGRQFLALAKQELRALYQDGRASPATPAQRARALEVLQRLGDLRFAQFDQQKAALREFAGRSYLIDERDPALRSAIDTAIVQRSDALVRATLRAGVEDRDPQVRVDAVRGLETLADAEAEDVVADRLRDEPSWLVRLEMVEYLGRVATPRAVGALVPLVADPEAAVRHKARESLARIAGSDHGVRREAWETWARARYPSIELPPARPAKVAAGGPGNP